MTETHEDAARGNDHQLLSILNEDVRPINNEKPVRALARIRPWRPQTEPVSQPIYFYTSFFTHHYRPPPLPRVE